MKRICVSVFSAVLVVGLLVTFMGLTAETNPAYQIHPTTWDGRPGYFGQLHRNGWYSFYDGHHNHVASFPAGEALYLH